EPGGDYVDQRRSRQHSGQYQRGGDQYQQRSYRAGDLVGFFFIRLRPQSCINGNERRGEHAFAEQVLQKVRDAKGGAESVGRIGVPEIVGKDAVPQQSRNAAQEDAGSNQSRRASNAGSRCASPIALSDGRWHDSSTPI